MDFLQRRLVHHSQLLKMVDLKAFPQKLEHQRLQNVTVGISWLVLLV